MLSLLKNTIELALAVNFRGCSFQMNRHPTIIISNIIIPEQLWQVLEPRLRQCEDMVFRQLRKLFKPGPAGVKTQLDNYMPIFICICVLFTVHSKAAVERSVMRIHPSFFNALSEQLARENKRLLPLQHYQALEYNRSQTALNTCKELATLYLAIFQNKGPFEWKDGPEDWKKLADWLRSYGYDGQHARNLMRMLDDYLRESTKMARSFKRWTPGLSFHPSYMEQILKY